MKKRQYLLSGMVVGVQTLLLTAAAYAGQPGISSPGVKHLHSAGYSVSVEDKLQNNRVANWEKSHAEYLHDLESASMNILEGEKHQARTDLIDARLYVSYAEADQIDLGKMAIAREDLEKSRELLQRAAEKTGPSMRSQIESLSETLQLSALTGKEHDKSGDNYWTRNRYAEIKSNFDSLIKQI